MKSARSLRMAVLTVFLLLAVVLSAPGSAAAQVKGPAVSLPWSVGEAQAGPDAMVTFTLDGSTGTVSKWTGQAIELTLELSAFNAGTEELCLGIDYPAGVPNVVDPSAWGLPSDLYEEYAGMIFTSGGTTACGSVAWDIEVNYDLTGFSGNGGGLFTLLLLVPPDETDTSTRTYYVRFRQVDGGAITVRSRIFTINAHSTVLHVAQNPGGCGANPCYNDILFGTSPDGTLHNYWGLQGALDAADDGDNVRIVGTYNVGDQQVTLDPNGVADYDLTLTYDGAACGASTIGSTVLGGAQSLLRIDNPGSGSFNNLTIRGLNFNGTQGAGRRDRLIEITSAISQGTINLLENDLSNSDVAAVDVSALTGATIQIKRNYIGNNSGYGANVTGAASAVVNIEDNSFENNNGGGNNQQINDAYTSGSASQTAYRNWWGQYNNNAAVYGAGLTQYEWASDGSTTPDWFARFGSPILRNTGCGVQVLEETIPSGNYTYGGLFWNGARAFNQSGSPSTYTLVNHGYDMVPFGAGSGSYVNACSRYFTVYQDDAAVTGLTLDLDYNRSAACATAVVDAYDAGDGHVSHWYYIDVTNWDLINYGTPSTVSGSGCLTGSSCIDVGNNFTRAILDNGTVPPLGSRDSGSSGGGSGPFVTGSPNSPTLVTLESLTVNPARNTWLSLVLLLVAVAFGGGGLLMLRSRR